MNEIIRVLSAIKGQQEYYGHNADKINKEGIVLTKRNADTVVKALEKQIPKKIAHQEYKHEGKIIRINGIDGAPYDLCPSCNTNLCTEGKFAKRKTNYCPDCGQRLDWRVEE